nr:hypothetical protein [Tanacetum cinerariifolium]
MERDKAERRLSESIRWNERFYLEMVRKPPSDDEGSECPRKRAGGPRGASGSGGASGSEGTGGNANGTGVRGTGPTV